MEAPVSWEVNEDPWKLGELLQKHAGLAVQPKQGEELVVAGRLSFRAENKMYGAVEDSFDLEITVPRRFPSELPAVREVGDRIPQDFHRNPDGTLCLGSPIRLRMTLGRSTSLTPFVERCVVPFLFGFLTHQKHGKLPFEELDHGTPGLLDEYSEILRIQERGRCLDLLELVGIKKRIANKRPCPCGSGKRVGRCHHRILNRLRSIASRSWFKAHVGELRRMQELERRPRSRLRADQI